MLGNIAFIGGIHGVGKSTICRQICEFLQIEYLSASDLLNWKDISDDALNKKVKDISSTQKRLINRLTNIIRKDKSYLLDGHYCLLNSSSQIETVPIETFIQINPISLNLILDDIENIILRLENRDQKAYDYEILSRMQEDELDYAEFLSKTLGINLNIGTPDDYSDLLISLRKTFLS